MAKTKRVWQPKKRKRVRKHGFLKRMASKGGKRVIKSRISKGRKRLAVAKKKK